MVWTFGMILIIYTSRKPTVEAEKRAQLFYNQGYRPQIYEYRVTITKEMFRDPVTNRPIMPVWVAIDDRDGARRRLLTRWGEQVLFLDTDNLRSHLHVNCQKSSKSEWLATGCIEDWMRTRSWWFDGGLASREIDYEMENLGLKLGAVLTM